MTDQNPIIAKNLGIEQIEAHMLSLPQAECPVKEYLSPGTYIREMEMAKDVLLIGHCHKLPHLNVITKGKLALIINDKVEVFCAPCIFGYPPGRKIAYAIEDVIWLNIWGIEGIDQMSEREIENLLIEKSETFLEYENQRCKELS